MIPRLPHARRALLLAAFLVTACRDEEAAMRERIAGDYVRELGGGTTGRWQVRQELTLRVDGTWRRTTHSNTAFGQRDLPPDTGTFRIQGLTLNLRSLVQPSIVATRFTINGDSLFGANAAEVYRLTGYDIGEEIFVRKR
jgi:hypothetical protein